jgi:hypothetical protein
MAQAFGGVCRKVKDVREAVGREQPRKKRRIEYRPLDERRALRHIVPEAAAQVVDTHDLVPATYQVFGDVRTDESGRAGDEDRHAVRWESAAIIRELPRAPRPYSVVSPLLRRGCYSNGGGHMANDPRNEDQEQITDENMIGKAAGEEEEFDDVDEFDEDGQDQDEGEGVDEA